MSSTVSSSLSAIICCFLAVVISSSITHFCFFVFPCRHHSHKWCLVMDELVQTTLRRHMAKLIAILAAKSSSPPPSSRPPPIPPKLLWPFVMSEILSNTDRYSSSPQPPEQPIEDWTSELTPPELTPLKLTPPSSQPACPSTLPLRNRRRRRNTLRFVPYNLFAWC